MQTQMRYLRTREVSLYLLLNHKQRKTHIKYSTTNQVKKNVSRHSIFFFLVVAYALETTSD